MSFSEKVYTNSDLTIVEDMEIHQSSTAIMIIPEEQDHLLTSHDVTFMDILGIQDTSTFDVETDAQEGYDNIPEPQSIGIHYVTPEGTTVWIPDVAIKPEKGTIFSSLEMAWDFYREYANKGGFEVKKGTQYGPNKLYINTKYFQCSKQGFKTKGDDENETKHRRKRASIRCGCEAQIRLNKICGNNYEVQVFVEQHNHSLVHKADVQFLRAYRQLNIPQKHFLHQVSHANLGPVKGFKIMKQLYGGFDKIGATENDCKNFRRDMNRFIGEHDAQMVVEKLTSKKEFLPNFSMEYMTDDSNSLSGLFWADSQAKKNYLTFGDVISFDATFRSNKYKMVFVPFTGIDNHNRCVTFGSGLISKENIQSYTWLLESFLKAFGQQPKIVVTDQDPAMKQAIENVFPTSRHRLCMWHIMNKLTSKVGPTLCTNETFKKRICDIVWTDKIGPDLFETRWTSIINDFELQDNKWLHDMFEMRSKWIPAYYREEPLSGLMRTSSRSESENHFFGQLTNTNLTLVEFFSHFETAMDVQRYTNSKNNHDTRYTTPNFKTKLHMEVEAAQLYTQTIFYEVQKQIYAALVNCHCFNVVDIDGLKKCIIHQSYQTEHTDYNPVKFEVFYNQNDGTISCSCRRYECYGLLCRHIFLVLKMFNVNSFPKKYVQRRWSREAVPPNTEDGNSEVQSLVEANNGASAVIRDVYQAVNYCVNRLVSDMEKLQLFRDHHIDLMKKADLDVPNPVQPNKDVLMGSLLGVSVPDRVDIQVPTGIRNKGTGSHKRIKSKKEISMTESSKKFRTCGHCNKREGHNIKTCPYLDGASTSTCVTLV